MGTNWRMPTGLHTSAPRLPVEGELPSFDGATGWLNSPPLTPADLGGKVVLASFWTYTCINWLRQLPYLRAWAGKYSGQGLVTIGVHTPEFGFEHDAGNVRRAVQEMRIDYPVATDNNYAVWRAFSNNYWPALYFADAQGRLRHHHFGEGGYGQSEMVIQQLLAEAGSAGAGQDLVSVDARGVEAPADWDDLGSPENYTGYERTENFASPGGIVPGEAHVYAAPAMLRLNQWALSGDWTMGEQATTLNKADGLIACNSAPAISTSSWAGPGHRPARHSACCSTGSRPATRTESMWMARATARSPNRGSTSSSGRTARLPTEPLRSPSSTLARKPSRSPSARPERSMPAAPGGPGLTAPRGLIPGQD